MNSRKIKRWLLLNLPYIIVGILATNLGEGWRLAQGETITDKISACILGGTLLGAFSNPLPSFHLLDLCVGIAVGALLKLAVYLKGKNAKKFRYNAEFGSARWGKREDIEPFIDPEFTNNVILSQTECITMNSRPVKIKYARNKNSVVIGGSGSGKTWRIILPNLLQMHSSYVLTDPNGYA